MSTNALKIPDDHVAFCVLIPTQAVDAARRALKASRVPIAEDVTVEADVVFWVNRGDSNPFDLPLRYPPDPAPVLAEADASDEDFVASAANLLDWAEQMPDGHERRLALVRLFQALVARAGGDTRFITIGMVDVCRRLVAQVA